MSGRQNPHWLEWQYHVLDRTTVEIAEMEDVAPGTITHWMRKHGVDARDQGRNKRTAGVTLEVDNRGYLRWSRPVQAGGQVHREQCLVHRLAAVAWFGLDAVAGCPVHHRTFADAPEGLQRVLRRFNYEANLEPVTKAEHRERHQAPWGVAEP